MLSEIRFALRSLLRTPGFSLAVILTLALGIGANTAIFSFIRGILLKPLPYHDAHRIVVLKKNPHDFGSVMGAGSGLFAADFLDLQGHVATLEKMATFTADVATVIHRGNSELVFGAVVSPDFFSVLQARPAVGRTFSSADTSATSGRLVVLGNGFWQANLGGDPGIVGQTISLNRIPCTVVGVMPADFDFPHESAYWVSPAHLAPENQIGQPAFEANGRGNPIRTLIGRLKPGVSIENAEQELAAQIQRLPNPNNSLRARYLVSLQDQTVGDVRTLLAILLVGVALVLLVACLNVANLMLSRATTRQREIGIRLALGSGGRRIVRQLLIESLLLALIGGTAGILLSAWSLNLLRSIAPSDLPRLSEVHLDATVLGFAFALTALTGVICGLAPVVGTAKTDLVTALKSGGRSGSTGGLARRLRSGLVAGEVAVALTLLVAAALLLRSFEKIQSASWGFEPAHVVSARVVFMDDRYREDSARLVFYRQLLRKLEELPGFESIGTCLDRIGESWIQLPFAPEGQAYATPADMPQASYHLVSPDYLRTLGIPLLAGRGFTVADNETAGRVAIIDANLAQRYFPGANAVGKRIQLSWFGGNQWAEIIGITGVVKSDGPSAPARPEIYLPFAQAPWNNFFVHARTPLSQAAVVASLKQVLREIDSDIPLSLIATMDQIVAGPGNARRFSLGLFGGFALLALILASVGIYAITAYGVVQRTRELGIRLALGATPSSVVRLMCWQGLQPVALGLGFGLAGATCTAFAMRRLLFGISPLDTPAFLFVPLLLATIATIACWLPARQASKTNPLTALQAE